MPGKTGKKHLTHRRMRAMQAGWEASAEQHLIVPGQALAEVGLRGPVLELQHGALLLLLLVLEEKAALRHVGGLPGVAVDHLPPSHTQLQADATNTFWRY